MSTALTKYRKKTLRKRLSKEKDAKTVPITWERFATYLIRGMKQRDAYRLAGFPVMGTQSSIDTAASRLAKDVEFNAYYSERRRVLLEETIEQDKAILRELLRIGTYDVRKIFDADGNLKPIHQIDDGTAAGIAGIEALVQTRLDAGNETDDNKKQILLMTKKIKMANKTEALKVLAELRGMYDAMKRQEETVKPDAPTLVVSQFNYNVFMDGQNGTSK